MKKFVALMMALALLCTSIGAFAAEITPDPSSTTPTTSPSDSAPASSEPSATPRAWVDKYNIEDEYLNHEGHNIRQSVTTNGNVEPTCVAAGKFRYACEDCYVRFWQVMPATGEHTYQDVIVTPATEMTSGVKESKCTVCGDVASTETILPTALESLPVDEAVAKKYDLTKTVDTPECDPHMKGWEDPTRAVAATCTKEGIRFFLCTDCGQEYSMVVPKGNHQDLDPARTEIKPGDEPTCTKTGVLTHYGCAICGESTVWTTELEMLPHTYGDVVTVEADCIHDERSTKTCTVCGHVEETVAAGTALGHAWERDPDWSEAHEHVVQAPTCTEQGMEGNAQVCDFCGAVRPGSWEGYHYIDKLDHAAELERAIELMYTDDDDIAYVVFTDLDGNKTTIHKSGKTIIEGYNGYGDVEIDFTPNTCTEAGKLSARCLDCGAVYEYDEEIPAHGHDWAVVRPDQAGDLVVDCTKPNSVLMQCLICNERYNMAFDPAEDHTWWVLDEDHPFLLGNLITGYKQQKFSDSGLVSYNQNDIAFCHEFVVTYKCGVDYCTITKDIVVPALDEHWAEEYIIQELSTCTEPGRSIYNCAECGYYQVEYTDPLGHDMVEGDVLKEATCTEEGVREMKCTRCDHTETAPIPPLGHHWVITVTRADCQKGIVGKTIAKCSICGLEEVRATDLGHQKGNILAHKDPTCTEPGSETYVCGLCHQLVNETKDALGHTYEDPSYVHTCILDGANKCIPATCKTGAAHGTIHKDVCERCGDVHTYEADDKPENHTMFKEDGDLNRFVIKTLPTCEKAGEAAYVCSLCGDTIEDVVLAPITHNMQVTFNTETGAYELTCVKLANDDGGKVNLKNLLRGSGYDVKVAEAVVDQMSETHDKFFAGIGCGHVETIKVVNTEYIVTKTSDTRGRIDLVEDAKPLEDVWPYVRITWRYTAANGDTVSFTTCRMVEPDEYDYDSFYSGTFKLTGLSVPDGYTCNFIYVEVVTDPDADELYAGDYRTYGSAAL